MHVSDSQQNDPMKNKSVGKIRFIVRRMPAIGALAVGVLVAFAIIGGIKSSADFVKFQTLVSFNGANGFQPTAALFQAPNGNFYSTAACGGSGGRGPFCGSSPSSGTLFEMTPKGDLTILHNFCSQSNCTDGIGPQAGLVLGTDGNFYGATVHGGANNPCHDDPYGCGTIFRVTPDGALTTLYSFCSQSGCTDGAGPAASLVLGSDGNFYGAASEGGNSANCFSTGRAFYDVHVLPADQLHRWRKPLWHACAGTGRELLQYNPVWRGERRKLWSAGSWPWQCVQDHATGCADHGLQFLFASELRRRRTAGRTVAS